MDVFNGMAGPKASGTHFQRMFASAPSVAASSSCNAISPQNTAGLTSGGFSDGQSLGISCQPLTSTDAGAAQYEDDRMMMSMAGRLSRFQNGLTS